MVNSMAQHKQQKQASDLEPEASLLRGPEHLDAAVEPTQPYIYILYQYSNNANVATGGTLNESTPS